MSIFGVGCGNNNYSTLFGIGNYGLWTPKYPLFDLPQLIIFDSYQLISKAYQIISGAYLIILHAYLMLSAKLRCAVAHTLTYFFSLRVSSRGLYITKSPPPPIKSKILSHTCPVSPPPFPDFQSSYPNPAVLPTLSQPHEFYPIPSLEKPFFHCKIFQLLSTVPPPFISTLLI